MNQWKTIACLSFAFCVLSFAFLAGCGSGGDAESKASGRPKIAGIVFQEDQFFRLVLFGMRDAAKKANVELLEANSNNKVEKEIELINTYVARKVDAICVAPYSKTSSVPALKAAYEKGIRIICHNTPIDADFPAYYIECSPMDLGEQTGKAAKAYIEKNLDGKAKIAILAFKSQVPEQSDARVAGFKKEVMQLPGVEIVAEQDAWLPDLGIKKAGDILTAHPEVNMIWSANEGGTVGAVLAVKNAGKAGKVVVFGTDASEQLLSFLQSPDNILQAITAQRPVEVGRMAIEAAVKALATPREQQKPCEKTYLKGTCLSRTNPDGVKEYAAQLSEWISKGK
ncbi:MAG TPA: substrate-binding domain-containing protein [Planctomycetota bacterium]|jgi:simple sugar transport system substrate-binding protein/ribose transport system substrate-binding protein